MRKEQCTKCGEFIIIPHYTSWNKIKHNFKYSKCHKDTKWVSNIEKIPPKFFTSCKSCNVQFYCLYGYTGNYPTCPEFPNCSYFLVKNGVIPVILQKI